MEMRKTIVYIGNRQDESLLFEKAIDLSIKRCNFLSLESGYWSLRVLKKSQPFWFEAIVLDLAKLSVHGIQFLKEIKGITHLNHVPVIVYSDIDAINSLETIYAGGASYFLGKPVNAETLVRIFNALGRNQTLPFSLHPFAPEHTTQNFRRAS